MNKLDEIFCGPEQDYWHSRMKLERSYLNKISVKSAKIPMIEFCDHCQVGMLQGNPSVSKYLLEHFKCLGSFND